MTVYAIQRNGNLVKHLVFEGDTSKMHTRPCTVIDLTFDSQKSAIEVANVLKGEVVKVA